ncbi:MAG: DinB family protein [Thermomicrobiales bacterium]
MTEQTVQTKADFLHHLTADRHALEDVIVGRSDEELTRPGPEGWSVKDHLAHLAAWERSGLALLAGENRAAAVGVSDELFNEADEDVSNEEVRKRDADRPLADVLAEFRQVRASTIAAVDALTDDDLHKPYSFYQPTDPDNQTPVIQSLAGNSSEHDREHTEWIQEILTS